MSDWIMFHLEENLQDTDMMCLGGDVFVSQEEPPPEASIIRELHGVHDFVVPYGFFRISADYGDYSVVKEWVEQHQGLSWWSVYPKTDESDETVPEVLLHIHLLDELTTVLKLKFSSTGMREVNS